MGIDLYEPDKDIYKITNHNINFFVFLDLLNCELEITRLPNENGRWVVEIADCNIGGIGDGLSCVFGEGHSPEVAIIDYMNKIKGQKMTFKDIITIIPTNLVI